MSGFAKCVIWLLALALLAHPLGQALPRRWFDGERFPYRCYKWEKQGRIYTRIGVERWKTLVPDMSRLLPDMVKKQVDPTAVTAAQAAGVVQETCVAEFTHWTLILASPLILCFDRPWTVWMMLVSMLLFNLPFVLIQRYNRPQLVKLASRLRAREERLKQ